MRLALWRDRSTFNRDGAGIRVGPNPNFHHSGR
jgi:hypothetical protein